MRALVVALIFASVATREARADVERFAVLIGNNRGAAGQVRLLYAHADARKLGGVLRDVGGFPDERVTELIERDLRAVREALTEVGRRIAALPAGTESVLFVFYSGHGDGEALALGEERFALRDLEAQVAAIPASVRLLVIDACRSGRLTRAKGGRPVAPFIVSLAQRVATRGMVVVTSAAESEDAQESDELRGSFFTHYLASALRGAADRDADGRVTLAEAYRYAYDNTVRTSSRVAAGVQHPTYRFDLRGKSDLVLTVPLARSVLELPPDTGVLILQGGTNGAVIAEVGIADRQRRLGLPPGTYLVRARGDKELREGVISLRSGESRKLAASELTLVPFAPDQGRRRGGIAAEAFAAPSSRRAPWAVELAAGALVDGEGAGAGARVGASWRSASPWSVAAGVAWAAPRRAALGAGEVSWTRVVAYGQALRHVWTIDRVVTVEALAEVRVGALRATTSGFTIDDGAWSLSGSVGGGARAVLPIGLWQLQLWGTYAVWLDRPELVVDGVAGGARLPGAEAQLFFGVAVPLGGATRLSH